jgi:pimeloyl-ACP methyl ester carboxylesterase
MAHKKNIGRWKSNDKKDDYTKTYADALSTLPTPSTHYDIPTSYGTLRVYKWSARASDNNAPIILLPGRTAGAPMWHSNLPYLIEQHTVYALDAIGDAGLSTQTEPITTHMDQAKYLEEAFEYLKLSSINLVGHSFGGYNAANYATLFPNRVASLSLIEPVFVLKGLNPLLMLKLIFATIPGAPEKWMKGALIDISGEASLDLNNPIQRMIQEGSAHYRNALPQPKIISIEQASQWAMPVYLAMAGNSIKLHDPMEIEKIAQQNIAKVKTTVWPDTTHSLPMERPKEISQAIVDIAT